MTFPSSPPPVQDPPRPADVDTGFWLWLAALPLLSISYLVDVVSSPATAAGGAIVIAFAVLLAVVLAVVVVIFLLLMRSGYRWARTALTAGAISSTVYVAMNLFGTERSPVVAVLYAVTAIFGVVLIGGGMYLLHRPETHPYFTR